MYLDVKVEIPKLPGKIIRKTKGGSTYIYYEYGRAYDKVRKFAIPKRIIIGKLDGDGMLVPNENFRKFLPGEKLPGEAARATRSSCIRIGAYIIVRKIMDDYRLPAMLGEIFTPGDLGLFLDLAAYSIACENNAAQYYPDYAYNHPLFTAGMRQYSDTKVSDFLASMPREKPLDFLASWNKNRDVEEKIYLSYDSSNKNSQAGDLRLVEFGKAKDDLKLPVFNYSIAYDRTNREPLFYEDYPGSIVDVSQLQYMIGKAKGYGYTDIGFILDRGYFSKANVKYMDENGYNFIMMVKAMSRIVDEMVLSLKGTFETKREYAVREYKVYGTTVKARLFADDTGERHFHVFHNAFREAAEKEELEAKIDRMAKYLKKHEGQKVEFGTDFEEYFELFIDKKSKVFLFAREKTSVIERELSLCGYFVIVSSEEMAARAAIMLYKSRDNSEKLFRGDKSYLGNRSMRVYSDEAMEAKIFVEFVALIVRNKLYTYLKSAILKNERKYNFMTVPAAVRELEKIEMIRGGDNIYRLDHAVTATQKIILGAFGLKPEYIDQCASELSEKIKLIESSQEKKQHA